MKKYIIVIFLSLFVFADTIHASTILSTFTSLVKQNNLPLSKQSFCIRNQSAAVASYNSTARLIPASVSKLYTFDFALAELGPDFRYTTELIVNDDTLYINGGGDPHFVIENLRSLIETIHNDQQTPLKHFVFSPNFYFNWQKTPDSITSSMITSLGEDSGAPIDSGFTVTDTSVPYTGTGTHYEFQSAPLSILIKQINNYSTNISADVLFARAGGPTVFSNYMNKTYSVTSRTVSFGTGSGLDQNYTTCDLTLRVIQHLEKTVAHLHIAITDIMSMPQVDPGVLQKTLLALADTHGIVAKSGYVDYHHNYAGIVYTNKGPVYFAVFGGFNKLSDGPKTEQFVEKFISTFAAAYTQVPFAYVPHNDVTGNTRIIKLN